MTTAPGWSFSWTGPTACYPESQTPAEDAAIGPVSGWFSKSRRAVRGDTYPMAWADDDAIYTSAGDPQWGGKFQGLDFNRLDGDPPDHRINRVNPMPAFIGNAGEGTKPTGLASINGSLYLAVQNLLGLKPVPSGTKSQHGSDAHIFRSDDHGISWTPDRDLVTAPMFPGPLFGGPAFVNTGRDAADAGDGFVYAVSAEQWDNGSAIRLGRAPVSGLQDPEAWEFAAGGVSGSPVGAMPRWTRRLSESVPVHQRAGACGAPEMIWISSMSRYLLLTWRLNKDFSCEDGSQLFIDAAPHPWGPFTPVHHEAAWESSDIGSYCPRLPLKWVREVQGGIKGWLFFSGAWREDSKHYHLHARPFRLEMRDP